MARPIKSTADKAKQVQIYLNIAQKCKLDEVAKKYATTTSKIMQKFIDELLNDELMRTLEFDLPTDSQRAAQSIVTEERSNRARALQDLNKYGEGAYKRKLKVVNEYNQEQFHGSVQSEDLFKDLEVK